MYSLSLSISKFIHMNKNCITFSTISYNVAVIINKHKFCQRNFSLNFSTTFIINQRYIHIRILSQRCNMK